jgi:hypothetical protein
MALLEIFYYGNLGAGLTVTMVAAALSAAQLRLAHENASHLEPVPAAAGMRTR